MVELRAVAFSAVTFFLFQAQASALEKISAPADHVRSALGEMNALLAQNPAVAPGWRAYLRLDALQAELRNGSDASPKAVAAIRDQLKAPLPELHRSEIQRLRTAVDRWAKSLDQSHLNPYWAEAAKEAAAFTPVTPQQLSAARAKSIAAVQTLQNRLHAVGAPAGPAWEQRLKLQALSQKLKNNRGPLLDASTSDMWSESLGVWNEPALVAAYSALQKDDQLRIAAENKETSAIFQQRLADLQTVVNDFSHVPAVEHYAKMGQLVHELEARGQAPKLTAVLRQEHSRPNMILKASAAFIEHQTKANLAEEFPVNDVILGTPVEGAGQLRGEAYLRLVPYESAAGFDLHL